MRSVGKLGLAALVGLAAAGCRSSDTALQRGDRFWADQKYSAALAEYRLAQDGNDTPPISARVAHAYAATGQLERAKEEYSKLLKKAPEYADQAVFDYMELARASAGRSDRFGMSRAIEAALEVRPGIEVGPFAVTLARYYAGSGDADRALEYFERALGVVSDHGGPRLLFEIAALHERQGDCAEAMSYLRSFLLRVPGGDSANDARFRIGSCAFEQGRRARAAGELEKALDHFSTVIDYGSPTNLQDQAWFERGEVLVALGRSGEALQAFRRVLELTPAGKETQISTRARRRVQELLGRTLSPGAIRMPPEPQNI
jgi:tetratricopeptide (TPR) repeat protein